VKQIGVFPRRSYATARGEIDHVLLPKDFVFKLAHAGLRTDLHAHHYFTENTRARDRLIATLEEFQPHVIQFEQPWLFPVLDGYLGHHRGKHLVVYSSQNAESELLKGILLSEGHPRVAEYVQEAWQLEEKLAAVADITFCVTESDASIFRSLSAKTVVVAPNGADRRPQVASARWDALVEGRPFAFVAGSAHPPNCSGFLHFLGSGFAFVPPEAKVIIAGGMAGLLSAQTAFRMDEEMVRRRTLLLDDPDEDDLNYFINRASVVMLPIAQGGGSNIKTAEALLSDRPIIGSSTAFRGFEAFMKSAGVAIEDDVDGFRHSVRRALSAPIPSPTVRAEAEQLLWEHCVSHMPPTIESLLDS